MIMATLHQICQWLLQVYVATEIGATNAFAFDLQAACSSFYGMSVASAYIQSGKYKKVLLIGADKMSSIVDYTDRSTCIILEMVQVHYLNQIMKD
jgi:3-oxoacyl-[acyl-carrier-protein] synthase III